MIQDKFETGMYIVDKDYKIVNFNNAMVELYPNVKIGDTCYKSVALNECPCEICPLKMDNALFYNPFRKEWIYANAAQMSYPGHGVCYNVQFQLRQKISDAAQEEVKYENMDEHIKELSGGALDVCAMGGYCEPGSPLFYANEQMLNLLGYSSLEEMHQGIDGLVSNSIHPDDVERVTRDLTRCAQNGGTFETTYRIHHKNNTWFWIVARGKRVQTQDGMFALLCVITDMSDFVKAQVQLHEENKDLLKKELTNQAVLESMPGGYHRCADAEGFPFLYFGASFEKITGWTKEEIETEFDNMFINMVLPEDIPLCASIITDINRTGYCNAIYRIKKKGGGYTWVSDSTMKVDFGDESFYHGVLADVTKDVENMEQVQRELEEAKQIAEASSRAKSTFLFNVSHDIRTPMNAIKGFTHIIGENSTNPELIRDSVEKINRATDILLQLLNDVLELSRIESGKDKPDEQPQDLNCLTEKLYLMFEPEITEAKVDFKIESDIKHPYVLCDELKCTRILMNMLSNAKKFTPAGGKIIFGITEIASDEQSATYRIYAKDTGIGMTKEFLCHAFEEFERVKTSTDSGKSGSGLGLAIIKRLVEIMGGTYDLSSEPGKGTEISVTLKFPIIAKEDLNITSVDVDKVNFNGKSVLVVEDNEFNREIARYIFEDMGFVVEEAENGAIAVEKVLNSGPGHYDVILMDIQMPVMDGYTAAKAIRSSMDEAVSKIPIIAMTANAFQEDKEKCREVGMNGHIGKPFEADFVIRELSKVL